MSFEYTIEEEQKTKKLTDGEAEEVAKLISTKFDTYDKARKRNLDMAKEVMDDVFFRDEAYIGIKDKRESWKTKVKMCKTYMFYQTLKAFIWKNIYANINNMFDVSGENQEANGNSNKQKANLVDKLEKMNIQQTLDKIIDRAIFYSDLISFAGWKKKYKEVRRPIDDLISQYANDEMKLSVLLLAKENGKNYYTDTVKIFDNPYIYDVNPANFVFDITQRDDWNGCPKIYKTYKTPESIINNKLYTISKDDKEAIKEMAKESSKDILSNQSDHKLQDETVNGHTLEVLEHWGNLKLKDGTVLKNWHAVVVAGKFLVAFEKNQRIINPFTYSTLVEDPDTKRGISLLYCVLKNSQLQDELLSRTCNMQALNENTPILAPKGLFEDDELELFPGKVIEYGDDINPNSAFKQLQFNSQIFMQDIALLSDNMAETSGIFPNMAGAEENRAKTATEISTKTEGQMTRLSMIIDNINQNLIIPIVKNVAEMIANFQFGEEQLYLNKNNQEETITIDDEVRQADYRYTYSDRTATVERSNKADMTVQALQEFAQFIPLNVQEVFTWYMEQKGVDNPERFLQQQAQIPQEIQDYLLQSPEIQQMIANYEQLKDNKPQQLQQNQTNQQAVIQQ